jgi:beta-lactamase class A
MRSLGSLALAALVAVAAVASPPRALAEPPAPAARVTRPPRARAVPGTPAPRHVPAASAAPRGPAVLARAARLVPQLDPSLQRSLEAIAARAPGVCGVWVEHLDDGRYAGVRGDERFPTMSTYKFPIAVAVLRAVDRRELSLRDAITLHPWNMNPGYSPLTDRHPGGGVAVSIHDLLDGMIVSSDNTACDVLMPLVGGGEAITREIARLGVAGLRVDLDELAMGNAWYGLHVSADTTWDAARWRAARDAVPAAVRERADRDFLRDPRDTTTPRAMVELLARVWRGQALSRAMTDTLAAMMARCATGGTRLRAGVPPGVKVADKTGTGGTWRDHTFGLGDVGVITLPGGGGRIAIAVYVKDVHGPIERAEATLATVARAVFERWNAPE